MIIINKSTYSSFDIDKIGGKASRILSLSLMEGPKSDIFFDMSKKGRPRYELAKYLLMAHLVPVEIVDSATETNVDEGAIIELLGAYFHQKDHRHQDRPLIQLYAANISATAKNMSSTVEDLATVVLLHELAHLFMDTSLESDGTDRTPYYTDFGKWREESFANAIVLSMLNHARDNALFNFAQSFIKTQSAEYALGEIIYQDRGHFSPDFIDRRKKEKLVGVCKQLQNDWLASAKAADVAKLEILEDAINYQDNTVICLGEYRRRSDAVKAIINDYCIKKEITQLDDLLKVFPARDHAPWTEKKTYSENFENQFYFSESICKNEKGEDIFLYDRWGDSRNHDFEDFCADAEQAGYKIVLLKP